MLELFHLIRSLMRRTGCCSRCRLPLAVCYLVLVLFVPGILSSRDVSLESMQIFTFHSWMPFKPTIYFVCNGEKVTVLPDVSRINVLYTFNGEESWQPLTELPAMKCKRCGVYERDPIKADDVFDEWELCPENFVNGTYVHFKENQLNATFSCPECAPSVSNSTRSSDSKDANASGNKKHEIVAIVISIVVFTILIAGLMAAYKHWKERKREEEQARFLKIFEEGDDIEDELGLGSIL